MKRILQLFFCATMLLMQTSTYAMDRASLEAKKETILAALAKNPGHMQAEGLRSSLAQVTAQLAQLPAAPKRKKGKKVATPVTSESEGEEPEEKERETSRKVKGRAPAELNVGKIKQLSKDVAGLRGQVLEAAIQAADNGQINDTLHQYIIRSVNE